MQYWEEVLAGLKTKFRFVAIEKNGAIHVSEYMFVPDARILIGGKTYIVSSFFKKDAKGNVVDKIGRLIEREADNFVKK